MTQRRAASDHFRLLPTLCVVALVMAPACGETISDAGTGGAGSDSAGGGAGGSPAGGTTAGGGAGGNPAGGATAGGGEPGDFTGGASGAAGSAGDGGQGTGGADYETCGPDPILQTTGPAIDPVEVLGEIAPSPAGGTLVDGIYDLVSTVYYGPAPTTVGDFRQAVRIRGGGTAIDILKTGENDAREITATIAPIEPPATSMTLTVLCPSDIAGNTGPQDYTAAGDELIIFTDGGSVCVTTHTRRQ